MSIRLQPVRTDAGWTWRVGDAEVSVREAPGGWEYQRTGLELPARIGADTSDPPFDIGLRLGRDPVVCYLDPPAFLLPGENRALWLAWPLEVVAERRGEPSDAFLPGQRWTLLGSVERGHVLPAAISPVIADPDDPRIGLSSGRVALRLRVHNASGEAVTLRRVPFEPADLSLYQQGDRLVAGDVVVEIGIGKRAEARSVHGQAPGGYELVARPTEATRRGLRLDWFLEGNRATEYNL